MVSHIIATVLAINNYRLRPTGDTVVKFAERSGDNPEALKAWFYPGDNFGQEFVYPKQRAVQLAVATHEPVPALAAETDRPEDRSDCRGDPAARGIAGIPGNRDSATGNRARQRPQHPQ